MPLSAHTMPGSDKPLFLRLLAASLLTLASSTACAAAAGAQPPQLGEEGQAQYQEFLAAPMHRAFAIAPGGAWGWSTARNARQEAQAEALGRCQANTAHKCVLYGVDGQTVFDAKLWPTLWGPYRTAKEAQRAPIGHELGQRFPDLAFTAPSGVKSSVAALRGKVAMLHFWGSWCGPCRREMPDLQKLYENIRGRKDVALVLLQVRERFNTSQRWVQGQGIDLPLFDSGAGDADSHLTLAGGAKLRDRDIATNFPTTYVLDKHGIVIFSHTGPVERWPDYEPFIRDAAARSGSF